MLITYWNIKFKNWESNQNLNFPNSISSLSFYWVNSRVKNVLHFNVLCILPNVKLKLWGTFPTIFNTLTHLLSSILISTLIESMKLLPMLLRLNNKTKRNKLKILTKIKFSLIDNLLITPNHSFNKTQKCSFLSKKTSKCPPSTWIFNLMVS